MEVFLLAERELFPRPSLFVLSTLLVRIGAGAGLGRVGAGVALGRADDTAFTE